MWEHKFIEVAVHEIKNVLHEYELDGWQLAGITKATTDTEYFIIFKRPVNNSYNKSYKYDFDYRKYYNVKEKTKYELPGYRKSVLLYLS